MYCVELNETKADRASMDQFLPLSWKLMDGELVPLLKVTVWETNTAMAQSQPLSESLSCARHCGKTPTALPNTLPSDLLMGKWAGVSQ